MRGLAGRLAEMNVCVVDDEDGSSATVST